MNDSMDVLPETDQAQEMIEHPYAAGAWFAMMTQQEGIASAEAWLAEFTDGFAHLLADALPN